MDFIRAGITRQTLAALAMYRQVIERCPVDVWASGKFPRTYSRIVYHAGYYAHLYLYPDVASYAPWRGHIAGAGQLEGRPKKIQAYTVEEMLEFADLIIAEAPSRIALLDIEAPVCGFTWYPGLPVFDHQILSLRHLHGHIGQLSEILLAAGVETDWMGQLAATS